MQIALNIVFSLSIIALAYAFKKSVDELIEMHKESNEEVEERIRRLYTEVYHEYPDDEGLDNWLHGLPDKTINGRVSDLEYSRDLMEKYFNIKQKTTPETTRYVKIGKEDAKS